MTALPPSPVDLLTGGGLVPTPAVVEGSGAAVVVAVVVVLVVVLVVVVVVVEVEDLVVVEVSAVALVGLLVVVVGKGPGIPGTLLTQHLVTFRSSLKQCYFCKSSHSENATRIAPDLLSCKFQEH